MRATKVSQDTFVDIVLIPTRYINTVQKSRAAQAARAMAGVIVATRPIRAEVAAVAAGADASVPLIVLEGRAGCDASLDLPLPTQAPGGVPLSWNT